MYIPWYYASVACSEVILLIIYCEASFATFRIKFITQFKFVGFLLTLELYTSIYTVVL